MVLTPKEVTDALNGWLGTEGRANVGWTSPGSRITGYIVHPNFRGLAPKERQDWLWNGVPKPRGGDWTGLNAVFKERATQIGVILAYSPDEYEQLFDTETDVA